MMILDHVPHRNFHRLTLHLNINHFFQRKSMWFSNFHLLALAVWFEIFFITTLILTKLSLIFVSSEVKNLNCIRSAHVWFFGTPRGSSVHGVLQARILEEFPFLPPVNLPDPGIKPVSSASPALQVDSLPLSHKGSPFNFTKMIPVIHVINKHVISLLDSLFLVYLLFSFITLLVCFCIKLKNCPPKRYPHS